MSTYKLGENPFDLPDSVEVTPEQWGKTAKPAQPLSWSDPAGQVKEDHVVIKEKTVTLTLDDALWVLDFLPSFKDVDNKPALLRICAAVEKVYDTPAAPAFRIHWQSTGNKVQAIKFVREATGYGLKEAKDAVEDGSWLQFMPSHSYPDFHSFRKAVMSTGLMIEQATYSSGGH